MRRERDLEPVADAHSRTIDARRRVNGNSSYLSEVRHISEVSPEPEVVGLPNLLRGAFELTTRTNSGQPAVIRVPHSILAILVTVALALVAGGFWLVSSITEMKTNLTTIQQNQREARATYSSNLKLMTAYATNETNRVQFMTGLLTPDKQRQVFEWDKANPRPSLPNLDDNEENH